MLFLYYDTTVYREIFAYVLFLILSPAGSCQFREKNNLFLFVDLIYFYLFLSFTFYPEMMEDPAAHINVYTYNTLAFFTGNLYDIDLLRLCHKCSKFDFFMILVYVVQYIRFSC